MINVMKQRRKREMGLVSGVINNLQLRFWKMDGPCPMKRCHFLRAWIYWKTGWAALFQISHRERPASYLSNDTRYAGFLGPVAILGDTPRNSSFGALCSVYRCLPHRRASLLRLLIDMSCILFHVKFEGRLSISVLRNETLLSKIVGVQNRSFKKFKKHFKGRYRPCAYKCGVVLMCVSVYAGQAQKKRRGG
jgi:hypothetical protein